MDDLAENSEATATATVWRDTEGFRVSIEYRDPNWLGKEYSTHRVTSSDPNDVRRVIARELGKRGFGAKTCSIWWKLQELIPLVPELRSA